MAKKILLPFLPFVLVCLSAVLMLLTGRFATGMIGFSLLYFFICIPISAAFTAYFLAKFAVPLYWLAPFLLSGAPVLFMYALGGVGGIEWGVALPTITLALTGMGYGVIMRKLSARA